MILAGAQIYFCTSPTKMSLVVIQVLNVRFLFFVSRPFTQNNQCPPKIYVFCILKGRIPHFTNMTVPFKQNLPRITVFLKFEIHKGTECLEATGSNNSQTSRMLIYHIEDFFNNFNPPLPCVSQMCI